MYTPIYTPILLSLSLSLSLPLSLLPLLSSAQYDSSNTASTSTSTTAATPSGTVAPLSPKGGNPSTTTPLQVTVGKDKKLVFDPDSVTASIGDTIQFQFFPANHSVVQSSFDSPCVPSGTGAIFSGFRPVASESDSTLFVVTINDTKPIWLYCSQGTHCNAGMAMAINPPTNSPNTLTAYKTAAQAAKASSPDTIQGGVLAPNSTTPTTVIGSGNASSSTTTTASASATSSKAFGIPAREAVGWGVVGLAGLVGALIGM